MEQLPSQPDTDLRPWGVLVLIAFLTVDGMERCFEVALDLTTSSEELTQNARVFDTPTLVSVFWIGADWLLAALLVLRSWAGRVWTQSLFAIHLFYLAHLLVVKSPEGWLYLTAWSRAQVALSVLMSAIAIGYLATQPVKQHLNR